MKKRKEMLEKHPYALWEGKNGKWYTYLPDKQKERVLKKRQTKQAIEDLVVEYWSNSVKDETVEEAFGEWNHYKLKLNKILASTFTRNQQIFERHFQQLAKKKVCELTPMEIESFLEKEIAEKHLTAKAFSNLKGLTKGILKRAKKRGLISFNVENIFLEMDVSDRDFARTIKEDCQEIFDEVEMEKIEQYLIENLDIRKTYGSILLDNHVDNRLIMGQMGHTDIRCTETHYHRNRRSVQQKIQIVSAIPELSGVGTK